METMKEHLIFRVSAFEKLGQVGGMEIDRFMLKYGRTYRPGPETFSGRRARPQECFRNATNEALSNKLTYVEGYVSVYGVPIHHAWNVGADGNLIDRTLSGDAHDRVTDYFGVAFSTSYLLEALSLNEHYGLLDGFYSRNTIADLIEGRADFQPRKDPK
jgi:hypothetical protein